MNALGEMIFRPTVHRENHWYSIANEVQWILIDGDVRKEWGLQGRFFSNIPMLGKRLVDEKQEMIETAQ